MARVVRARMSRKPILSDGCAFTRSEGCFMTCIIVPADAFVKNCLFPHFSVPLTPPFFLATHYVTRQFLSNRPPEPIVVFGWRNAFAFWMLTRWYADTTVPGVWSRIWTRRARKLSHWRLLTIVTSPTFTRVLSFTGFFDQGIILLNSYSMDLRLQW